MHRTAEMEQDAGRHGQRRLGVHLKIPHYTAVRFENVLSEGRTHPLVLACRNEGTDATQCSLLVKAIGCPEIFSTWQLVAEVVGNATAKRMGVETPGPAVARIGDSMAGLINQSLAELGYGFAIQPGFAAGCDYIRGIAPFTIGQMLTPELRSQAARLFTFDMLSQNADRRPNKLNCGLTKAGLVAFDFELCFAHKFLPLIGQGTTSAWEPSNSGIARNHLFYQETKANPPSVELIEHMVGSLTEDWWRGLVESLPSEWHSEAQVIGTDLRAVADHADEFAKDIITRCLI